MKRYVWILAGCLIAPALFPQDGRASTLALNGQTYTTQFNTGSGPDNALLVLEFGPAVSYAFGYSWNPASATPTGYDMLTAVAGNSSGNLTLDTSVFDFGDGPEEFVNTLDYLTNQPPDDYPNSWFNYFTADGGGDWTNGLLAVNQRILADGSADDWVWQNIPPDDNFNPQVFPAFAIATPEPASLAMLGVGFALLLRRRKTNR